MGQTQFRSDDTVKWWLGFGDGSDGDYSSSGNATDAPVDSSCSGTSGTNSLSATNASFAAGKPVLIHQTRGTGAGNWELNQIDSYTAGTITLKKVLQNTYTDSGDSQAQVIQLKQYKNFTQNTGHTLTAKAWDGNVGGIIAFLAKGTVTIEGSISAIARGYRGNANSSGVGDRGGYRGEGSVDAGGTINSGANGSAGGGGQTSGSNRGGGAGGGHAASGTNGAGGPGVSTGGNAVGHAELTTMLFGGSGGAGGFHSVNNGAGAGGGGGTGGGIIAIFANEIIATSATSISSGGGAGNNSGNYYAAGGGGAAGSILLKAKNATLGTTKFLAPAGSAGTGGNAAGAGSVGRIHLDYSVSYTGTTNPTLDYTLDTTIVDVGGSSSWFMFM